MENFYSFFHSFYKRTPEFVDLQNIIDIISDFDTDAPNIPTSDNIDDYYDWFSKYFSKYEIFLSSKIEEILETPIFNSQK